MNRRNFLMKSAAGAVGVANATGSAIGTARDARVGQTTRQPLTQASDFRALFPRAAQEVYLNAGGLMPLGQFSLRGLSRYEEYQELGSASGRGEYIQTVRRDVREMFGNLIGAEEREIGLVHCTKAGEQIVIDGLRDEFGRGQGVVTNDLHFAGSLHNLMGLSNSGVDVTVVRSSDWVVPVEEMVAAITDRTSLVTISLVSNINGHIEDIRTIADAAHRHGAIVFADIIQAAGIMPVDVRAMGIDAAACSCYKWMYGVHGTGFFYLRHELQGARLPDRLFPGHGRHNYTPWVDEADPSLPDISTSPRQDATRYQPGHVSYLGYCAAYEGLKVLDELGVESAHAHNVGLNNYLLDLLDVSRYRCITPNVGQAPIITFKATNAEDALNRLRASDVAVSCSAGRIRVSPALFSNESDMDRLAAVLN